MIKDSGKRAEFTNGYVRDTNEGKLRYDLIPLPMLKKLAKHYTDGALKYSPRNWEKAEGKEALDRFKESAYRHFMQWLDNETDEDHAMALVFNIFAYETIKQKELNNKKKAFEDYYTVNTLNGEEIYYDGDYI